MGIASLLKVVLSFHELGEEGRGLAQEGDAHRKQNQGSHRHAPELAGRGEMGRTGREALGDESQRFGLAEVVHVRADRNVVRLDARGAWEMDLASGVTERLGRRQVDERMERFLRVAAPVIAGRAADIAYVDMRYSNGFSIGWRDGVPPGGTRPVVVQAPQLQDPDANA